MSDDGMATMDTAGGVLSGDQWEQAQYLPAESVNTAFGPGDPKQPKAKPAPAPLHRVLTGDEWEQAQRMPGPAVKGMRLPLLPTIPKAASDVTQTPLTTDHPMTGIDPMPAFNIKDPSTYANPILRQIVNPALEHPIQSTLTGLALATPGVGEVVGAVMAGTMVHSVASYGWQKAAESQLSPADRARAEADPDRISGEAAAMQAAMLGLGPLIHVGVKGMKGPAFGEGMLESGARGLHEHLADPDVAAERTAPFEGELNDLHARLLEQQGRIPADVQHPDGFQTTATGARLTRNPRAVEGLDVPEPVKAGKITPLATDPASAPLEERAALDQSVRDYQAQTAEQDMAPIAAARLKEAERIANADKFRPRRRAKDNLFETPQGAQILGATAARNGMPDTASPYHPDSPLAALWKEGHDAGGDATAMLKNLTESGFATAPAEASTVELPTSGAGRSGSTTEAVARAKALIGADGLRSLATAELQRRGGAVTPEAVMAATEQVARHVASREPIPEYPDGFSMGGALTDNRVPGAVELPKTARGSDLVPAPSVPASEPAPTAPVTEDDALAQVLKPVSDAAPSGINPVEGTGETKTRGLSRGVEATAIEHKLVTTLGDLPEYRTISMADQAAGASELLASDPALARRIALGEVPPPAHLLPESVFVAVENKAIADGDVQTIRELATGKLATDATTMGQRIRTLGERDPESPVAAIQQVADARASAVPDAMRASADVVTSIKQVLAKHKLDPDALAKFIDSLRC